MKPPVTSEADCIGNKTENENSWIQIKGDLSRALQTWDQLSLDSRSKRSPDEVKLERIKGLIREITSQMEDLDL